MEIPELDWKTFKEVRSSALDRFCRGILDECRAVCVDDSGTAHERYLKLYDLIRQRDKEMADAFDDFRRSTAILSLMVMCEHNLVTPEELARFSLDTRHRLAHLQA